MQASCRSVVLSIIAALALLGVLAGAAAQAAPNTVTKIAIVRGAIGQLGTDSTGKNTTDASLDQLAAFLTSSAGPFQGQTIQYAKGTVTAGAVDYQAAYTPPGVFATPLAGLSATQKQILNNVDLIIVCPGLSNTDYAAYSAGTYDAPTDWNTLQVPILLCCPTLMRNYFTTANTAAGRGTPSSANTGWDWAGQYLDGLNNDTLNGVATGDSQTGAPTSPNTGDALIGNPANNPALVLPTDPLFAPPVTLLADSVYPTNANYKWVHLFKSSAYVVVSPHRWFGPSNGNSANNNVFSGNSSGNPGHNHPFAGRFSTGDYLSTYNNNDPVAGVTPKASYRRFAFCVSSSTDYQGFPTFFDATNGATDDCKLILTRAMQWLYNPANGSRPAPYPGPNETDNVPGVSSLSYTIGTTIPGDIATCYDLNGGVLADVTLTWSITGPAGTTPTITAGQGTLTPTFFLPAPSASPYTVTLTAVRPGYDAVSASKTITFTSPPKPQPVPNPGPNVLVLAAPGVTTLDYAIPAAPSTDAASCNDVNGVALVPGTDVTLTWTITGPQGASTAGGTITSGASNSLVPNFHLAQPGIYTVTLSARVLAQAIVTASKTIEFGIPSAPYIAAVSPGDNRLINALYAAASAAPNNPVTLQFDHPISLTGPGTLPLTVTLGTNAPVTVNCTNPSGDLKTWIWDGSALNATLQAMPAFTKVSFSLDTVNVKDRYSSAAFSGTRYFTWNNVFAPATGATPMPKQQVLVVSNYAGLDPTYQSDYQAFLQGVYGIDTPITFWDNGNFATNGAQSSALVIVYGNYAQWTATGNWLSLTKPFLNTAEIWWRADPSYGAGGTNVIPSADYSDNGQNIVAPTDYSTSPFYDGVTVNADGTVPWWTSSQYIRYSDYASTDIVGGKTFAIASRANPYQKFGHYWPANTVFYQHAAGGNTATAAGRTMNWAAALSYDLDRAPANKQYPGLLRMTDNAKKMSANVHKYFAQPNGAPGVIWKSPASPIATPMSKVVIRFDRPISGAPGMLTIKLQDGTPVTTCTATATALESNMQFEYAIPPAQMYHATGATTLTLSVNMAGVGNETETGYSIPYIGPAALVWTVALSPAPGSAPVVVPSQCSPAQGAQTGAFPASVVVHFSKPVAGVQASDLSVNPSIAGYPTWLATQVVPLSGSAPDQDWIFTGPWSDTAHAAPAGNPPGYVPLETVINLRLNDSAISHIYDPVTSLGVSPATWTYLYTWTPVPAAVNGKLWTLYE